MIDVSQIEYVHLKGEQITNDFYALTNGFATGLMSGWLRDYRLNMGAVGVKYQGKFIGWSAYLREEEGIYSLGTYVAHEYRGGGFGRMALTLLIEVIKEENALAICKYGGSLFYQFDQTYHRIITDCGLKTASIYQRNDEIETAA